MLLFDMSMPTRQVRMFESPFEVSNETQPYWCALTWKNRWWKLFIEILSSFRLKSGKLFWYHRTDSSYPSYNEISRTTPFFRPIQIKRHTNHTQYQKRTQKTTHNEAHFYHPYKGSKALLLGSKLAFNFENLKNT